MLVHYDNKKTIVGCDEAGRGCLAGSVFAAAVILPTDFENGLINDSKKLSFDQRMKAREIIMTSAIDYAIAECLPEEIDQYNILNASILAMHRALEKLKTQFDKIIVDGNRFKPYKNIPHQCIIKGDAKYYAIAAASILAKTERDLYMMKIHEEFPQYHWNKNKGYPTADHRRAIEKNGICQYHRKSFAICQNSLLPNLFQ
ncbi:MAG: ribonuclease HII [Bacteroidetes bacterium]|nr:MAG: ribonuclease HII [Bacteroidota bacterium]